VHHRDRRVGDAPGDRREQRGHVDGERLPRILLSSVRTSTIWM
jgi:hypothetical protein